MGKISNEYDKYHLEAYEMLLLKINTEIKRHNVILLELYEKRKRVRQILSEIKNKPNGTRKS